MSSNEARDFEDERFTLLNVFCAPLGKGFRVYLRPTFLPPYLLQYFDRHLETDTGPLDFDDLDRCMTAHEAACEKHVAPSGAVELTASGPSARVLGAWLATALGSGERLR